MADIAKAIGFRGASSYQRYEDANLFRKPYLPLDLAEKLARVMAGKGNPPIAPGEVMALTGTAAGGPLPRMIPIVGYVGAGAEVKVKVACGLNYECQKPRPQDAAEAQRICATKGKRAEFASTAPANVTNYATGVTMENYEHLYLCV